MVPVLSLAHVSFLRNGCGREGSRWYPTPRNLKGSGARVRVPTRPRARLHEHPAPGSVGRSGSKPLADVGFPGVRVVVFGPDARS